MAAPLLRYGDCFQFCVCFSAHGRVALEHLQHASCEARRSRAMLSIFLEHPIARIRSVQREPRRLQARDIYKGRDYDIAGTSYDPKTGQVTFPPRLTEAQRDAIRDSLVKPSQSETQDFLENAAGRDPANPESLFGQFDRDRPYACPRGPFAGLPGASMTFHAAFPTIKTQRTVFSLPRTNVRFS